MKNKALNYKIIWIIGAIAALCACFLLCRYSFFSMHGMKQWPLDLFIVGLIVIVIASVLNSRKVLACTVIGYIGGFALGMIFNTDGVDQGGGATNNAWIIWTLSFIAIIIISVFWELVSRHKKKYNK